MAITVDGELAAGVTAKDIILGIIARIGVDGGVGHVIEYRGSAIDALVDGGAHDDLQHVDRRRRPRRDDRTRRHDVRLPRGPPPRAEGCGMGRGGRLLAKPYRPTPAPISTITSTSTPPTSPLTCRGARTRPKRSRSRRPSPRRTTSTIRSTATRQNGRCTTWTSSPARRSRTSPSTVCSSARAPTPASKTCGQEQLSS